MNPENMIRENEFDLDNISIGESNESENKSIQNNVKRNWWHDYFSYWHTDSNDSLIYLYCNSCGVCIHNISCICCFLCDE